MKNTTKINTLIFLLILLSACSSMSPLEGENTPVNILEAVEPGDLVQIETFDGKTYEFKVTFISAESIKSEQIEIPLKDIKTIKSEKFSLSKTAGAGVGLTVVNVLLFYSILNSL